MKQKTKVTIGITTYNRKQILEWSAKSLYESDLSCADVHIRIYDDRSSEFEKGYLEKLFPTASSVIVNDVNKKADLNTYDMYVDFLKTDDDYLFNADSDLIYRRDWLSIGLSEIQKTDGVLSIFNTPNHKSINDYNSFELIEKKDIGAAGTLFSRQRVQQIIDNNSSDKSKTVDWSFSKLFFENGVRMLVTKKSLVQHIGFSGQNSAFLLTDYGEGFIVDSEINGQIINDVFFDVVCNGKYKISEYINQQLYKSKAYLVGNIIIFPLRLLKQLKRNITRNR